MKHFPTEQSLIDYFSPTHWQHILDKRTSCHVYPTVTLAIVRDYYGLSIMKSIVRNNLVALYMLTRSHEPVNEETMEMAADLFIGKYGAQLSMFGMLLYFAEYMVEYKSSYANFDFSDLLRQCGRVFLPRWLAREHDSRQTTQKSASAPLTGHAAMLAYLRREYIAQGKDPRTSYLYFFHLVSDEEIEAMSR